jgi:hypothetical protein
MVRMRTPAQAAEETDRLLTGYGGGGAPKRARKSKHPWVKAGLLELEAHVAARENVHASRIARVIVAHTQENSIDGE